MRLLVAGSVSLTTRGGLTTRVVGVAALTFVTAALAGCVETEIVGTLPNPSGNSPTGQVTVCRKRVFEGDGVATIISIDGNALLRSGPGVCFSVNLTAGRHTMTVLGRSWAGPDMGKKTFAIDAGAVLYFAVKNEEIEQVNAAYISDLLHANYKMVDIQK